MQVWHNNKIISSEEIVRVIARENGRTQSEVSMLFTAEELKQMYVNHHPGTRLE